MKSVMKNHVYNTIINYKSQQNVDSLKQLVYYINIIQ